MTRRQQWKKAVIAGILHRNPAFDIFAGGFKEKLHRASGRYERDWHGFKRQMWSKKKMRLPVYGGVRVFPSCEKLDAFTNKQTSTLVEK